MSDPCRVVALASGRGSNLAAILDTPPAWLNGEVVGVIANVPGAGVLGRAEARGIATELLDHRDFPVRDQFDAALLDAVQHHRPDLVVLAGFMRVLGPAFVRPMAGRLLNIHPSLLPALPGLHTHERALRDGLREHGATVHFVDESLDGGPPVIQARVPVLAGDTPQTLAARVLAREHQIYPLVVRWFGGRRLVMDGDRVTLDGHAVDQPLDLDRCIEAGSL